MYVCLNREPPLTDYDLRKMREATLPPPERRCVVIEGFVRCENEGVVQDLERGELRCAEHPHWLNSKPF